MYERDTYTLRRYEIVAPHVRNDGTPSEYREALRHALARHGFTGWSEIESVGYWLGKLEPGTTFVIYADDIHTDPIDLPDRIGSVRTEAALGSIGRRAMPDQDAIQVVRSSETVTLVEA